MLVIDPFYKYLDSLRRKTANAWTHNGNGAADVLTKISSFSTQLALLINCWCNVKDWVTSNSKAGNTGNLISIEGLFPIWLFVDDLLTAKSDNANYMQSIHVKRSYWVIGRINRSRKRDQKYEAQKQLTRLRIDDRRWLNGRVNKGICG